MTHLRMIAPIPVNYTVVPGAAERDAYSYGEFWQRVSLKWREADVVQQGRCRLTADHATRDTSATRYAMLDSDSLSRPLHALTIDVDDSEWSGSGLDGSEVVLRDATLRWYQNGVAALEFAIDTGPAPTAGVEAWLDDLQSSAIDLAERAAAHVVTELLVPALEIALGLDRKGEFVDAELHRDDAAVAPLWVSRALVVDSKERHLLAHWTKDTVGDADADYRDDLLEGRTNFLVRWLNYAFVDTEGTGIDGFAQGSFADHWAGLRYAQVVYGSLDHVDSRLAGVLARASSLSEGESLEELTHELEDLSARAESIILGKQVLTKYMKRGVRAHFDHLLDAWDYETLVENPVRFKVDICHRKLEEQAARKSARSSIVTDVILLSIAVTSVALVGLTITSFGRDAAGDPASAAYDLGASDFTQWFATQPIDAVLLAAGAASALLVALYIFFRRR